MSARVVSDREMLLRLINSLVPYDSFVCIHGTSHRYKFSIVKILEPKEGGRAIVNLECGKKEVIVARSYRVCWLVELGKIYGHEKAPDVWIYVRDNLLTRESKIQLSKNAALARISTQRPHVTVSVTLSGMPKSARIEKSLESIAHSDRQAIKPIGYHVGVYTRRRSHQ